MNGFTRYTNDPMDDGGFEMDEDELDDFIYREPDFDDEVDPVACDKAADDYENRIYRARD